jgi:hypothetical protein
MEENSKAYLESLIQNQVEESTELEYKSSAAIDNTPQKKKEISKDVSAMANSAGGVIIYGIKEYDEQNKRHLPKEINPIIRKHFSKEWLEQIIQSNIQPKIQNIIIIPITISDEGVVYKVVIPQSSTAHQANDKKYYKRYNFESVPMEDYEIRDIMNRLKNPDVIMEFKIEEHSYERKRNNLFLPNPFEKKEEKPEIVTYTKLIVYFKNLGNVYANYINGYVYIPYEFCDNTKDINEEQIARFEDKTYVRFYCENTVREVVDSEYNPLVGGIPKYGPSRFDPLLPRMRFEARSISLVNDGYPFTDKIIYWELNADNAELKKGNISTKFITFSSKN